MTFLLSSRVGRYLWIFAIGSRGYNLYNMCCSYLIRHYRTRATLVLYSNKDDTVPYGFMENDLWIGKQFVYFSFTIDCKLTTVQESVTFMLISAVLLYLFNATSLRFLKQIFSWHFFKQHKNTLNTRSEHMIIVIPTNF